MAIHLEDTWKQELGKEFQLPYMLSLRQFLLGEKRQFTIFPPSARIFHALNLTPFPQVKVIILGQDPYHTPGKAHGLAFSVPHTTSLPPSLGNIFLELQQDTGCPRPSSGDLSPWAQQGVLLLNTVLTVRKGQANSHKNRGWERFTDTIIQTLSQKKQGLIFLLWGKQARDKLPLIDTTKHHILQAGHPSPYSAHLFFGHKPFSQTNALLQQEQQVPIRWCIP